MTEEELRARYNATLPKSNKKTQLSQEDLRARWEQTRPATVQQPVQQPTPQQTYNEAVAQAGQRHGQLAQQGQRNLAQKQAVIYSPEQQQRNNVQDFKTVLENYSKENNRLPTDPKELKALAEANGLYSGENKYQIDKLQATQSKNPVLNNEIRTSQLGSGTIKKDEAFDKSYGKREGQEEFKSLDFTSNNNSDKYEEYKQNLEIAKENKDTRNIAKYSSLLEEYKKKYKELYGNTKLETKQLPGLKRTIEQEQNDLNELSKQYLNATTPQEKNNIAVQFNRVDENLKNHTKAYQDTIAWDEIVNKNIAVDSMKSLGKNVTGGTANILNAGYALGTKLIGDDATTINANALLNYTRPRNAVSNTIQNIASVAGSAMNPLSTITGINESPDMAYLHLTRLRATHPENQRLANLYNEITNKTFKGTAEDLKNELDTIQKELYQYAKDNILRTQDELDAVADQVRHNETYGSLSMIPNAFGTVGNMIPSMIAGAGIGEVGSMAMLGLNAGGSSMDQALQSGARYNQALNYGILSGATEVATEKMFDTGANKLLGIKGGLDTKGLANRVIDGLGIKSKVGKVIANTAFDVGGEMVEEMVAEAVNPLWKALSYEGLEALPQNGEELGQYIKDIINAGVEAIPSTLLMQGGGAVLNTYKTQQLENGLIKSINESDLSQIVKNQLINEVRKASTDVKLGLEESNYIQDKAYEKGFNLAAQSEQMKQRIPQGYTLPQSTIDILSYTENNRPGLNIAFDTNIQGNGTFVENPDGTRTITLNPNSQRAVEFTLTHELGHDLKGTQEYTQLQNLLEDYAKGKPKYQESLDALNKTYQNSNANYNLKDEATNDMLGQAIGEQEFYNKLAENPTLFNKVTSELQNLLGDKDTKLKNKIEKLTRNAYQSAYKNTGNQQGTQQSLQEYPAKVSDIKNITRYIANAMENETDKTWKARLRDAYFADTRILNKNSSPLQEKRKVLQQYLDYKNNNAKYSLSEDVDINKESDYNRPYIDSKYGIYFDNQKGIQIEKNGIASEDVIYGDDLYEAIDADTPKLRKNKLYSKHFGDYYFMFRKNAHNDYTIYSQIAIKGNENLINELEKGMKRYVDKGTRSIIADIEALEYSRGNNNISNDNATGFNSNNEASNLLEGENETGDDTRNRGYLQQNNRNIDKQLKNSNQSSFSMPETVTIGESTYDVQGKETSPYQRKVKKNWDIDSIQKQLMKEESPSVPAKAEMDKFDSLEELKNNIFYHGSQSYHGNLKAGSTLPEDVRTGGYGEAYHTISLSQNRNIASNFASQGSYGVVTPVLLRKDARVIEMPQFEDSIELEDILPELWKNNIDAVKIGDWDRETRGYGEQELVVLNPNAIVVLGKGTTNFKNYGKPKFENLNDEQLETLYQKYKTDEIKDLNEKIQNETDATKVAELKQQLEKIKKQSVNDIGKDTLSYDTDKISSWNQFEEYRDSLKDAINSKYGENVVDITGTSLGFGTILEVKNRLTGQTEREVFPAYLEDEEIFKNIKPTLQNLLNKVGLTIQYSKSNASWQQFLDKNFNWRPNATKTNFLPSNEELQQQERNSVAEDAEMLNMKNNRQYSLTEKEQQEISEYANKLQNDTTLDIDFASDIFQKLSKIRNYSDFENIKQEVENYKDKMYKGISGLEDIANLKPEDVKQKPMNYKQRVDKNTTNQRGFFENMETSQIVAEETKNRVNATTYEQQGNSDTLEEMRQKLDERGNDLIDEWKTKSKNFTAKDVALGAILVERYQQNGDWDSAARAVEKLADMGTEAGRAVQMYSIFQRLSPETMAIYQQKTLNQAFEEMKQRKTGKWVEANKDKFKLTDEDTKFIYEQVEKASQAIDDETKQRELSKIEKRINEKLPAKAGDAIRTLRRISMLFNPKTQVRNVVGNSLIMPVNAVTDFVGTQIDKAIAKKTGTRTTNYANPIEIGKGFVKGIKAAVKDYKTGTRTAETGNKWEFEFGSKPFNENTKNKAINAASRKLNKLNDLLSAIMSGGDRPFYEGAFNNSLKGQMKANKVDVPTQDMIDIAVNEALQRTWNDDNEYTKTVLGIRKAMNGLNVHGFGLGDLIIPFARTPANLTKAMVEYSPVGFIPSVMNYIDMNKAISRGELTPQQQKKFVSSMSKAVAGTMLYAIAGTLARGIGGVRITGSADDDKDVKNFEQNVLGIQPYSVILNGKSYTYSWANPINAPLAIMADSYKLDQEDANLWDKTTNLFKVAGNVLTENSFLQGIQELFSKDSLTEGLVDSITGMPESLVPTFISQIASAFDNKKRQTFEYKNDLGTISNKIKNKLPGAKNTLAPQVNTFGEEIDSQNNFFNVFLNPANVREAEITDSQKALYEVYQETKDKTIFPMQAPYYTNTDTGEKKNLSSKERVAYQKASGQYVTEVYDDLFNNEEFNNSYHIDNEAKTTILKKIAEDGNAKGREAVGAISSDTNSNLDKLNERNEILNNAGIPLADYYIAWYSQKNVSKKQAKKTAISQQLGNELDKEQKEVLYGIFNID